MSDLDSLVLSFQSRLSDVMEAVLQAAVFQVTRLVEDIFLVEVKRRRLELESLQTQLQRSDGGGQSGRKDGCGGGDVEPRAADSAEGRPRDPQDDMWTGFRVGESWKSGCRHQGSPDSPAATQSPGKESQATEDEDLNPDVDVKEEELLKPSCSAVHVTLWSSALADDLTRLREITVDSVTAKNPGPVAAKRAQIITLPPPCLTTDEARPESENTGEAAEAQSEEAEENDKELLKGAIKPDPQISDAYPFPEDPQEPRVTADGSSLKLDSAWCDRPPAAAGLLENHRLERESDPVQANGSLKHEGHELSAVVQFSSHADHASSSGPPEAKPKPANEHVVTVKEEVLAGCDGCEEGGQTEGTVRNPGTASFCCSVKQNKPSSAAHKPNSVYHDAAVQEVMKQHAKVGAGLRLQAAIQQLHRPVKKPPPPLSSSAAAPLSAAPSQVVNLHHMNRIPSTSKAAPALSVQRLHLGDKQTPVPNRTGASWVSIKSQHQSAHSHHPEAAPRPESPPYAGPRHFLRCGQCGKCFPHPSNLKAHLQTHTGERPFCCSLCGRSFTKLSNLKAHRRVHTGERPYCCSACGKRFTQKCNLKRHQRIHLDI